MGAAQPAVADGRAPRSLRSLVRPPLNGSIVSRTGDAHMQPKVLSGVVVHRSGHDLTLTGRLRIGLFAAPAIVFGVIALSVPAPASCYFRVLVAAGMTL